MKRRKREAERISSAKVTKDLTKGSVGLVVRIHKGRHASEEIKSNLRALKLNKKYDAIFAKLDEEQISKIDLKNMKT